MTDCDLLYVCGKMKNKLSKPVSEEPIAGLITTRSERLHIDCGLCIVTELLLLIWSEIGSHSSWMFTVQEFL